MKPVGYNDETRFFETVWRFSAFPLESWDETMRRLSRAIAADAKALGVAAEASPQRVVYAYRHHPSLGQVYSVVVAEHMAKVRVEREARGIAGCASVDDILALYEYEWKNRRMDDYWTDKRICSSQKFEAMRGVREGEITTDYENESRFRNRVNWINELEKSGEFGKEWIETEQKIALAFFRSCRKALKYRESLTEGTYRR